MTGYESKRAAARDKLDDDDALTIAYQSGYYDGKKAAQSAQEPVATLFGTLPVYDNTPPQRPWVDLTDEEIKCIEETTTCSGNESWLRNLTRNLEAKLKEKNT